MSTGVYAYITMDGTGKEAIDFYKNALNAEVSGVQTFGDLPQNPEFALPDEAKNRVLHAQIQVGNTYFMLSDSFPGQPFETGSQVNVCVTLENAEKSKSVFEKLKTGGEVLMPLQETHWSSSYGQVKDKFGITWQISTN
ncbi:VOC family protein [Oceanobacillus sojae]|uniref:VOC family protein n=1 Tax=Oceanobacillus sojae TaxID=582851 RepID=UPI000988637E|nr:VOC family protein [Oceanobacillus sojae]MCT1902591.1 VOC family protein [Oceanobacillus sojae]